MCSIMGYCTADADYDLFKEGFDRTISRGPDDSRITDTGFGLLGFHRLAIMGLTGEGMQPFSLSRHYLVCNGEIYGFRSLKKKLETKGYTFKSDSDCEILLPLYEEYGTDMFRMLDAEYALVLFDGNTRSYLAARDPIGIRPLYYGYDKKGAIVFASEPKNLIGIADHILPFPPGHYYKDGKFVCYRDMTKVPSVCMDDTETVCRNIHDKLTEGIRKRLDSDAPLGFLLSGGLDSSLVCAISARILDRPIRTFAIGMSEDAIDLKYAKEVADHIGSEHTEIIITKEDVISSLPDVIQALGTFDITTIRASVGMYLICKAIHETTDIRVLMTGEISDELFGYKYTDFAPSKEAFQEESAKRIRELHMYDVLRADRCISVNSMEARVPFGDLDFVSYVMSVDPAKKMNIYQKGKYLLRHAFEGDYLPYDILMREKAAFSDAVGHSLVDYLKEYAENSYTDDEFEKKCKTFTHAAPFTKESLLYREIFEQFYPGQGEMIKDFWMPNRSWKGCDVDDPSARVLSNYGASGI
ncbi:asparagine synthetase B [Claveliimonas bilis]|uniref:asparagine synthase (glutamine-hydrolyzing) n=1 Tax=Claveliimonas bilis TaxID=3028070 RepID=A0ABM8I3X5_9FIRM|nr:asparagine synthase B [Claveliimonas bilis]BDZ77687.1 asparagine synthetase B [Claveliimonas bilis]BDZ82665.1 asparagine synthetase B [Claveliimonas bilis]